MKIVVDTNIIFSALLNTNGTIGNILFNSDGCFEFYSCNYMRYEIIKHWDKLKNLSKMSEKELSISYSLILSKLKFINEEIIPNEIWLTAEQLTQKIDLDDTDFVALTKFLNGNLWTGDRVLYNGLINLNFKNVLNSSSLLAIRTSQYKS